MTAQEIFDKVGSHLVKQGHRSIADNGLDCRYLASNGDMCAVGCLFTPGMYKKDMEGLPVSELIAEKHMPEYFEDNFDLLVQLQNAHDTSSVWKTPESLVKELNHIAEVHSLTPFTPA